MEEVSLHILRYGTSTLGVWIYRGWIEACGQVYCQVSYNFPKHQPPNWEKDFYVFLDALGVVIGSVLMQEGIIDCSALIITQAIGC